MRWVVRISDEVGGEGSDEVGGEGLVMRWVVRD